MTQTSSSFCLLLGIFSLSLPATLEAAARPGRGPQAQAQPPAAPRIERQAPEPNWITIAPNRRYLMFEDGTSFVPIGVAMAGDMINFDYYGNTRIEGKRFRFGDNYFGELFADMKAHGENFLRIDIEGTSLMPRPDIQRHIAEGKLQFLENPVGVFNEEYARRIDRLLALAEQHDIYLSFVLITHTCDVTDLADNLDLYPYHVSKGGPLRDMNDLLVDARAKQLWLQRMRYISDRWGHSRRIAMWELYNELLNCGGTDAAAAAAWTAEMGTALRRYEMERYGKAHPVIVSTVDLVPKHRFFVDSPGTDLMVTHYYGDAHSSGNPVLAALDIHRGVLQNLKTLGYSRPFMENERTLSISFPQPVQREMEDAAAWALMASGASSPGCTWVRMGPWGAFRTRDVIRDTHRAMARVLGTIDFANFDSRPLDVRSSNAKVTAMAIGDQRTVFGWVLHNNPDDYDIQNIHAWQEGKIRQPRLAPLMLINWLRIVHQNAPPPMAAEIHDQLAQLLVASVGLSQAEGRQFAGQFLTEAGSFRRTLDEIGEKKRRKPDVEKLQQALMQMKTRLEAVEKEHGILRKAYGRHPEVTSRLTLKLPAGGERELIWYNTQTGAALGRQKVSGQTVTIDTPPFRKHVAFTMR